MKNFQLIFASASCLVSLACGAVDTTKQASVPDEVRSIVGPSDALLAYQKMDLLGDGNTDAVIIVRHQNSAATASDQNPCDLMILERKGGVFFVVEKSDKVVDCVYNEDAQNSSDLSENLEVKPLHITYVNQHMGGYDSYSFKYSKDKKTWYLSQAISTFSEDNEKTGNKDSFEESVNYPASIKWMPLSKFDPLGIQKELKEHKSIVH
jgi:hypothetical protein